VYCIGIKDYFFIQKLLKEEVIPFEVIDLKNNDVLPKITDLALDKKPPFEGGDGTDKGFKDMQWIV
jgi:antitoxin component of RelBE/YafQ-DinJ toxin-antitoxin module